MTPLYSVAFCSYNGEKYINQQIDSILNQTFPPAEIVVCDDGSTDRTPEILKDYQEKYPAIFRLYFNEQNLRSVKNFEKAISLCSHEIIFLSDQDDIWVKNKAEIMLNYFEEHLNIDVLATNGYCIDENGTVHERHALWDIPRFLREKNEDRVIDYYGIITLSGNIATGASMAFRSKMKEKTIPFPIIKDYHHDEWIATVAAEEGKFELLDEKLFYYRTHKDQQVGGVFFDKTEKKKKELLHIFDLIPEDDFRSYKRILKILARNYQVSKFLEDRTKKTRISESIKNTFLEYQKDCYERFPIKSKLQFSVDKITGKRQLKD